METPVAYQDATITRWRTPGKSASTSFLRSPANIGCGSPESDVHLLGDLLAIIVFVGIILFGLKKSFKHPNPTIFPLRSEERYGVSKKPRRYLSRSPKGDDDIEFSADVEDVETAGESVEDDDGAECASSVEDNTTLSLEEEVVGLKAEKEFLQQTHFSLERFKNDLRGFRYYTGLPNYNVFHALFCTLFQALY